MTETLADETDQHFGWQSDLEVGATAAVLAQGPRAAIAAPRRRRGPRGSRT